MVKVVNEKKIRENLEPHPVHVHASKDTPFFFSSMAEAVPGYYSFSLHGSIH